MRDDVFGLELRTRLGLVPPVEDFLHQPGQPHQRRRALLPERLGPRVTRAIAPGADVEFVERILARRFLLGDALETFDLAERAGPIVLLFLNEAEGRILD